VDRGEVCGGEMDGGELGVGKLLLDQMLLNELGSLSGDFSENLAPYALISTLSPPISRFLSFPPPIRHKHPLHPSSLVVDHRTKTSFPSRMRTCWRHMEPPSLILQTPPWAAQMGAWHVRWEMMTQVGWGVGGEGGVGGEEGEAEESERSKLMGGAGAGAGAGGCEEDEGEKGEE